MDKDLFIKVCDEVIGQRQGMNGIGTLAEKTVHSVLKNYYSPDPINHEIKVGAFVADICTGSEIIEIQTRNFDKLRRKLSAFLSFAPVTIVYPIHNIKWLRWVNPQTGEISPPRKSPKPGSPYSIFPELYRIKDYLTNPNLNLKIVMVNLEEYRFLDGWSQDKKKGSSRCDRIPTEIVREISINSIMDYQLLIPESLTSEFTSKDYKKAAGLPMHQAQTALNILYYLGVVDRIGKNDNSFVYERCDVTDKTSPIHDDLKIFTSQSIKTGKSKLEVNLEKNINTSKRSSKKNNKQFDTVTSKKSSKQSDTVSSMKNSKQSDTKSSKKSSK